MRYVPESISDVGLEKWFKRKNLDYQLFVKLMDAKVSVLAIARALDVSPPTARKYVEEYRREQS